MPQQRRTTLDPLFNQQSAKQGPLRCDPDSEASHTRIIGSNSIDNQRPQSYSKLSSNLVQRAAQEHEVDRLKHQRLMEEQNACHLDELKTKLKIPFILFVRGRKHDEK